MAVGVAEQATRRRPRPPAPIPPAVLAAYCRAGTSARRIEVVWQYQREKLLSIAAGKGGQLGERAEDIVSLAVTRVLRQSHDRACKIFDGRDARRGEGGVGLGAADFSMVASFLVTAVITAVPEYMRTVASIRDRCAEERLAELRQMRAEGPLSIEDQRKLYLREEHIRDSARQVLPVGLGGEEAAEVVVRAFEATPAQEETRAFHLGAYDGDLDEVSLEDAEVARWMRHFAASLTEKESRLFAALLEYSEGGPAGDAPSMRERQAVATALGLDPHDKAGRQWAYKGLVALRRKAAASAPEAADALERCLGMQGAPLTRELRATFAAALHGEAVCREMRGRIDECVRRHRRKWSARGQIPAYLSRDLPIEVLAHVWGNGKSGGCWSCRAHVRPLRASGQVLGVAPVGLLGMFGGGIRWAWGALKGALGLGGGSTGSATVAATTTGKLGVTVWVQQSVAVMASAAVVAIPITKGIDVVRHSVARDPAPAAVAAAAVTPPAAKPAPRLAVKPKAKPRPKPKPKTKAKPPPAPATATTASRSMSPARTPRTVAPVDLHAFGP